MKCDNCGFIFNGDFDKCPYCGMAQSVKDKNILHTTIALGHHNSIRVRTVFNVVFVNIFLLSFFIDWLVFNFQYRITLFSFVICFGAILILSILYAFKSPLSVYERIDLYFIVALIIAAVSAQYGSIDLRPLFGFVIIPSYLLVSTIAATILLIVGRGKKFRPIMTEWSMVLRLLLSVACLTLFLIAVLTSKHCMWAIVDNFILLQKITIYGGFGVAVLSFLNFNLILFLSIFNKVKYIYGK